MGIPESELNLFGSALVSSANTAKIFGLSQPNTAWRVRMLIDCLKVNIMPGSRVK